MALPKRKSPSKSKLPVVVDTSAKTPETLEKKERRPLPPQMRCMLPPEPPRSFAPGVTGARMRAIISSAKKWVNGTRLRYYFFNRPTDGSTVELRNGQRLFVPWAGRESDLDVVREAFKTWAELGIGLTFEEVTNREDAEIRIGFMAGDGHWSYLGRDILKFKSGHRTMNFDGDLSNPRDFDTALHEIGHTLGMPHEHQNPNAGIVWNEDKVYDYFAQPPNGWDRETTHYNILRKIPRSDVLGSDWDPNSVMHYSFHPGLIRQPIAYSKGLDPAPGLSEMDKAWVRNVYPPQGSIDSLPHLRRYHSLAAELLASDQFDAVFYPTETGRHTISSFGETDLVLTVFEDTPNGLQFIAGDDDSGVQRNAGLDIRLDKGKRYVIRARLFYNRSGGGCTIMVH